MPASNARPGRGPGASQPASGDANANTHTPHTTDTTASTRPTPPDGAAAASRSVTEIVNSLFARFDADDGGTITLSEWLGVVDPDGDGSDRIDTAGAALMTLDTNADGALSNAEVSTALGALDTDGDGQLTRAEHAAARGADGTVTGVEALLGGWRGHGGGPGHGGERPVAEPVVIADAVTAIFAAYDSDDSGTIAVSELLAALDGRGHAGRGGDAESRLTAAVSRIDTNTDGALSAAELTAALNAADANQDGSLGAGEAGPGSDVGLVGVLLHHLDLPGIA
ncbi:MAG: hypothetical protein RJA10_4357 [Pseudomonadota bacterium]|jgi:Ca2+-binding EF-hand superfamily protein